MSTPNLPNASKMNANTNKVANGTAVASETNGMTNGATIPSQRMIGNSSRPEPPLAIVQPMPNTTLARSAPQREAKNKTSSAAVPKIEKILSRGEVLPPLKDSKTVSSDQREGAEKAATAVEICESALIQSDPIVSPSHEIKAEPEPELQYLEMAESASAAAADGEKPITNKEDAAVAEPAAPEPPASFAPGANIEHDEVNGAQNSDAINAVAAIQDAKPTKTESDVPKRDATVLSGGDSAVETLSKASEYALQSKPSPPKPVEKNAILSRVRIFKMVWCSLKKLRFFHSSLEFKLRVELALFQT